MSLYAKTVHVKRALMAEGGRHGQHEIADMS